MSADARPGAGGIRPRSANDPGQGRRSGRVVDGRVGFSRLPARWAGQGRRGGRGLRPTGGVALPGPDGRRPGGGTRRCRCDRAGRSTRRRVPYGRGFRLSTTMPAQRIAVPESHTVGPVRPAGAHRPAARRASSPPYWRVPPNERGMSAMRSASWAALRLAASRGERRRGVRAQRISSGPLPGRPGKVCRRRASG